MIICDVECAYVYVKILHGGIAAIYESTTLKPTNDALSKQKQAHYSLAASFSLKTKIINSVRLCNESLRLLQTRAQLENKNEEISN